MYKLLTTHFGKQFEFDSIEYSNPFVGNTGLNYAALLGFKDIYLFGIDNGYKFADKHHSSLSLYYNEKQEAKYHQDLNETFPARGNFGGEVRINHLFGLSIHNMAQVLENNPEIRCVNSSDGAYVAGAEPRRVEHINPTWPDFNKRAFIDDLLSRCFKPFNVASIDFQSAINVPFFNDVVNKLLDDWKAVPREHNAIQSMMQRHHDYLLYLFMSRDSHLYRVLIGSINYFYANIISLMMAHINDSDDVLTEKLNSTITILERFFTDAKHIYAGALERHDTAYFIGLNIFK